MRSQALAIAIVLGGGVATLVMSLSSLEALQITRDAFYRDYRFADVFVNLTRAPERLREAIEEIPGVQHVETRVVAGANLEVAGFDDPVTGLLQSLPDGRNAELNQLYLRSGRFPEGGAEVVLSEPFAEAHGLRAGDTFGAVINGRHQSLRVVGIALSPEHIYQIRPGDLFPDFERYGLIWMSRSQLAAAYDMEGAFNNVVLTLSREAREGDVIERLDALLAPYGTLGAIGRDDQLSHWYLQTELEQLEMMATVFPTIFLAVAAFLLNVVLTRLVGTQRDQIAILKAFGYSNFNVGLHYAQLVVLISLVGLTMGVAVGLWLGHHMAALYQTFFRFPYLEYQLRLNVVYIAVGVSLGAALLGAYSAVRAAQRLPPAEAMRPEAPPIFRATLLERLGLQRWLAQPSRMVLRNLERKPGKALLSIVGIAFACGILMVGRFQEGAIAHMIQVQFGLAQRDDLTVTFVEPTTPRVMHELAALPGVYGAEGHRIAPAVLRVAHREYRGAIQGLPPAGTLRRVLDAELVAVELPRAGLALGEYLADLLHVGIGDTVEVEFLEGRRIRAEVAVSAVIQEYIGASAYMDFDALHHLLREGPAVSGVHLAVDEPARPEVIRALQASPRVAGIADRGRAVESFYESMADIVLVFAFISTLLAGSIAFGVVYNSARIALAERARELASLRVLGFTRGEITYILVGELAVLTLAAIPLGFLIGLGLIAYIVQGVESDLYRVPMVVGTSVYAFAATVVIFASLVSAAVVARRLYRLDLVAVLKTRE
ncbi:FtsX-like permease family protein [Ectothiorhodospiraceae bacterium 2226]|nr:FtsX-like permease family protein [Ectothiorhodospiraceae bacterium 2226]